MKEKISASVEEGLLKQLDTLIGAHGIRNRSQALEHVISLHFKQDSTLKAVLIGSNLSKKNVAHLPNLLKRLHEAHVSEIIIAGFNTVELIYEQVQKDPFYAQHSTFLKEASPAGTAGVLKLAAHYLSETFVVCYLDVDLDLDVQAMHAFHQQTKSVATMAVTHVEQGKLTDYIRVGGNKITEFQYDTGRTTKLQNAGLYMFEPAILEEISSKGSLENDYFPAWAKEGKLTAYLFDTPWRHVGK